MPETKYDGTIKGEMHKSLIVVKDFKTFLSMIIENKDMEDLNDIINHYT